MLGPIFSENYNTSTCALFTERDDGLALSVTVPIDPKGRKHFGN